MRISVIVALVLLVAARCGGSERFPGARVVSFHGYSDCIRLENDSTKVTLCPSAGGRVLEYSLHGQNALYHTDEGKGWVYEPGKPRAKMLAGRFDIGPEQTIPRHPELWMGKWRGEIVGPRTARLISQRDQPTGVQLVREFELAENSSRLRCTQSIRNISNETKEYCHWSRTFALGGGTCVIPLTRPSRFPNGYVMYGPGPAINFRPEDPHIRRRGAFLEITGAPKFPKLGIDSYAGWFAYLMKNDIMFVKRFPTYRDRVYNEVAGLTISIWYPDAPMCELEPIGPREVLAPRQTASFTETWYLLPRKYPASRAVDLEAVAEQVANQAR